MAAVDAPAARQPRVSHDEDEPETCTMNGANHEERAKSGITDRKVPPSFVKAGFQPKVMVGKMMRQSHVSSSSHHSLGSLLQNDKETTAEDDLDNETLSPEPSIAEAVADASRHVGSPGGIIRCTIDNGGEPCVSVYCRRYHTCRAHIEALHVVRNGEECRFCQRCSSFQPVGDFDGARHTCRDALSAYNAARREARKVNKNKRKEAAAAAANEPDGATGERNKKAPRLEPAPEGGFKTATAPGLAAALAVDNSALAMYQAAMNAFQARQAPPARAPVAPPPPASMLTQLDAMRMMATAAGGASSAASGADGNAQMLRTMQFMNATWLQWCTNLANAPRPQ
jgi:hypothetical protein